MKTVFFESLRYKLITKNDFYYGSCPDIHFTTPIPKRKTSYPYQKLVFWELDSSKYFSFTLTP